MAITKNKKKELLDQYVRDLGDSVSVYVINQNAIPVGVSTEIRREMRGVGARFNVVRKRLFLKAVEESGLPKVELGDLCGSIVTIFSKNEDFSPLKLISKYSKVFEQSGVGSSFGFLGAWLEREWKDGVYVSELASIPSKEELLSKFMYLLKYPVQSFVATINELSKKSSV